MRVRIVYKDSWYTPGGVPQFVVDMDQSDDFISQIMPIHSGNFFDMPPPARTLIGLTTTMNRVAAEKSGSAYFDISKNRLDYFINCNTEEVSEALNTPSSPSTAYFGVSKNLITTVLPLSLEWEWQRILSTIWRLAPESLRAIEEYELSQKRGAIRFISSKDKMEDLKLDKLRQPEVKRNPDGSVVFGGTVFLEYEDSTDYKEHDFVILPIEFVVTTNLTISSMNNELDWQSLSGEIRSMDVKMKKCQFIQNFAIDEKKIANVYVSTIAN